MVVTALLTWLTACSSESEDARPTAHSDQLSAVQQETVGPGSVDEPPSSDGEPATPTVPPSVAPTTTAVDAGSSTLPTPTSTPTSTAPTPPTPMRPDSERANAFPLHVVEGRRYLEGADGLPFLMLGDAAWSLIAELDKDEVDAYLANRRKLGFNTVLVSLIEHRYSSNPPANTYGAVPFTTPGDFSTPNEEYFQYVDWVLERLSQEGFLVLATADYLGWEGGDDGWWKDMTQNGSQKLYDYGRFIGARYAHLNNVLWVAGGDYNAPDKELVDAVARGIADTDPDALQTAHLTPDLPPRDYWTDAGWLDVDNVYTYNPVYQSAVEAYQESSMPFFLMESTYENEHDSNPRQLRTQAYHAVLTGATGEVFGNNPIWHFGSGGIFPAPVTWQEALEGPGSRSMAALGAIMGAVDWPDLQPDVDGEFLTGGVKDDQDRAVASVSRDRSWAMVYVPNSKKITLDVTALTTPQAHLTWYDPTTGEAAWEMDFPSTSEIDVETPGDNADGDSDWVLVVTAS